jgi:outer membrane protein assembly factor BamA
MTELFDRSSLLGLLAPALFASALSCSTIPPGRSAVDSVRILDAKSFSASDIEAKLGTQPSRKFLFLFQGIAYDYSVYDEAVLQRDMTRVERFYRAHGFMDAHARVSRLYQVKSDHVRVEIVVEEGPPTINRNVVVVGLDGLPKDVADAANAAARNAVPPSKRFDETAFKDSEAAVKKALTDRGYAYATVDSQAELDVGQHTIDYGFAVVPGLPAVFGEITFSGLDPDGSGPRPQEIPEGPLRRAIDIRPGAPYSTAAIDAATQALLDLEVFSAVEVVPRLANPPPADRVVPLTVKVEPVRLRQITLGGGLEIDAIKTDVHAVAGWEDHNFLGGLRDFAVSFKPGVVLYPVRINNLKGPIQPLPEEWLRTELRQPGFLEARTTGFVRPELNVFPLLVEVNPPDNAPVVGYHELKLPIGVDRTFGKRLFVSLDYTFQVENPFAYVHGLDPALERVILSFPELVAHLDFRDSAVRPHEGIYVGNTLQVAGLGGTAADVREQPEVRTYLPIAHGVTFATRASLGFLFASNYGKSWNSELESSVRTAAQAPSAPDRVNLVHDMQVIYFRGFFSGGPTTNRGYPILEVAPHGVVPFLNPSTAGAQLRSNCDPTLSGFNPPQCYLPTGGFGMWELQNDVRFDVSGPLSAAVFCDMGDVSPRLEVRLDHLHLSCGVGVAYDTPVGPIRVDLGYRIQPLQVVGYSTEDAASRADPVNGLPPKILGVPIALAVGIGQAF